jgi:hypothetical protein
MAIIIVAQNIAINENGTVYVQCPYCPVNQPCWVKAARISWHIKIHHNEKVKPVREQARKKEKGRG